MWYVKCCLFKGRIIFQTLKSFSFTFTDHKYFSSSSSSTVQSEDDSGCVFDNSKIIVSNIQIKNWPSPYFEYLRVIYNFPSGVYVCVWVASGRSKCRQALPFFYNCLHDIDFGSLNAFSSHTGESFSRFSHKFPNHLICSSLIEKYPSAISQQVLSARPSGKRNNAILKPEWVLRRAKPFRAKLHLCEM